MENNSDGLWGIILPHGEEMILPTHTFTFKRLKKGVFRVHQKPLGSITIKGTKK